MPPPATAPRRSGVRACRRLLAEELGAYPSPETESIYRDLLEAPPDARDAPASPAEPQPHDPSSSDLTRRGDRAPPREPARRRLVGLACGRDRGRGASPRRRCAAHAQGPRPTARPPATRSGSSTPVRPAEADVPVGASPTPRRRRAARSGSRTPTPTPSRGSTPRRTRVVQTIPVGNSPSGITTGGGAVWVTNSLDGTVSRIDPADEHGRADDPGRQRPASGSPTRRARLGREHGRRHDHEDRRRQRQADRRRSRRRDRARRRRRTLWASERAANRVARIDPTTGSIVADDPRRERRRPAIAFGSGAAWVANSLDGTVSRIDPTTNSSRRRFRPATARRRRRRRHGVWVSNQFDGTLVRIDPRTNQVARANQRRKPAARRRDRRAGTSSSSVAPVGRRPSRRHADRADEPQTVDSIDPAVAYDTTSWPILRMTNDGLVAFNQASGARGHPARARPRRLAPHPDRRRQDLHLPAAAEHPLLERRPVKASDVRSTFERDFEIGKLSVRYYDGIVGANGACRHRTLRPFARDRRRRRRETGHFHLVAPDPDSSTSSRSSSPTPCPPERRARGRARIRCRPPGRT